MEILLAVLAVPLLTWATQLLKNKFGLEGVVSLVVVSILLGFVYTGFTYLVPESFQEHVVSFVSEVGFVAVIIYEFLKKYAPTLKESLLPTK